MRLATKITKRRVSSVKEVDIKVTNEYKTRELRNVNWLKITMKGIQTVAN